MKTPKLFCILVFFYSLAFVACSNEDEGDRDKGNKDYIVFNDANFKAYLLQENLITIDPETGKWRDTGRPIDANLDGEISQAEAEAVKYINCASEKIVTLSDLKNFPHLQYLDCQDNRFTALTPLDLSVCTELESLNCSDNNLNSIDISNNKALKYLRCSNGGLTKLNVSQNTYLLKLDCNNNPLNELNLKANTRLSILDCSETGLSALSVKNSPALEQLFCYKNQLESLDLSSNKNLNILQCHANHLLQLDLSKTKVFIQPTTLTSKIGMQSDPNEEGYSISVIMTETQKNVFRNYAADGGNSGVTIVV